MFWFPSTCMLYYTVVWQMCNSTVHKNIYIHIPQLKNTLQLKNVNHHLNLQQDVIFLLVESLKYFKSYQKATETCSEQMLLEKWHWSAWCRVTTKPAFVKNTAAAKHNKARHAYKCKDVLSSWIRRFDVVKMAILLRTRLQIQHNFYQIPSWFFWRNQQANAKTHTENQGTYKRIK